MRISQVAKQYHISIRTLRYWEKVGVIPPIHKVSSGYRDYTKSDLSWIRFIICMKHSGMSIKNLQKYVHLYQEGLKTRPERKQLLKDQLKSINKRLLNLLLSKQLLAWKIKHYDQTDENYHHSLYQHVLNKILNNNSTKGDY